MNSDLDTSENEKKSQASPPALSPETLKNFLAASDAIQRYVEQNHRGFEQLAKTTAVYESMNLRVMPEVLKIIDTQRRLVDFNKILFSPALELATAVNQSIERFGNMARKLRREGPPNPYMLPTRIRFAPASA